MSEDFDYIIVGAGAAGCVLANRLSADASKSVLLIEAGRDQPPGREHPSIVDPYPVSLADPQFSWPDLTATVGADTEDFRPRFCRHYLQGLGVGGGSNIQGMVALRGYPGDYDGWQAAGADGWAWTEVLPYFRRLESDLDYGGAMHGREGPIPIRRIAREDWAPFSTAFARSVEARGYARVDDFNGDFREGIGPLPMANLPDHRVSASMAYLNEAVRQRRNLTVLAEVYVERVEFRGPTAIGVLARNDGAVTRFRGREVILSAGAVHSPAILLRSGLGPAAELRELGIEIVHDLPGVGRNLMNHVGMLVPIHLKKGAEQPLAHRSHGQCCLRLSSRVDGDENDMIVVAVNKSAWHPLGRRIGAIAVEVHKTHSMGSVRLSSSSADAEPEVDFNLLSDPRDLARLIFGLTTVMNILGDAGVRAVTNETFFVNSQVIHKLWRKSRSNWVRASAIRLLFDLQSVRRRLLKDSIVHPERLLSYPAELRRLVLSRAAPPHHVSCTCRMGRSSDPTAVVDSSCHVRGVRQLRVVDASVMPRLIRANTHIPVLMIAEKMADTIAREGQ